VNDFKILKNTTRYDKLLEYYSQKLNPKGGNSSLDDFDSFVGEPMSRNPGGTSTPSGTTAGTSRSPEFPECKKFCPGFRPAYIADNEYFNNPDINKPVSKLYPDGTDCPRDVDGNLTVCAPNAECIANCTNIVGGKERAFAHMAGGILLWILMNAVTAMFFSKVPEIAESLSRWSDYSPKIRLGGASRSWDETGMDAWTKQEKSNAFSVGGAIGNPFSDTGVFAVGKTVATMMKGPKEDVQNGKIVKTPWARGEKSSPKNNVGKTKAKVYKELLQSLGLKETDDLTKTGKTLNIDGNTYFKFATLRPKNPTGLAHSEIWSAIEKELANFDGADESKLRDNIKTRIDDLIKRKEAQRGQ
jgi:hypothetical protein